jgi:hypothetical protein
MPKFQPAAAHEAEPAPLSENRQALAAKIVERDATRDTANAETASSARLGSIHDDVAPARDALAEFDHQHAIGLANWSRGLVTGKPVADAARRAKLAAAVADAELASAAATSGQDECQRNAERISKSLGRMETEILELAQAVAVEEATKLLPAITAAIAHAEALRLQLDAARAEISKGVGDFGRATSVGPALHEFDNARRAAESRPFELVINPNAIRWQKFVAGLTQDAGVDFEGAQELSVTLAPVHTREIDPVSAAARAAESFPTRGGWSNNS